MCVLFVCIHKCITVHTVVHNTVQNISFHRQTSLPQMLPVSGGGQGCARREKWRNIFIFIHHNGSIPDNVIYKIQYSKRKKKYNTKVEMQYNMQHAFCFQYLISFLNRENAWRLLLAGSNRQRKLLIIYDRETRMFSHLCVLLSLKLANFYLHLSAWMCTYVCLCACVVGWFSVTTSSQSGQH